MGFLLLIARLRVKIRIEPKGMRCGVSAGRGGHCPVKLKSRVRSETNCQRGVRRESFDCTS